MSQDRRIAALRAQANEENTLESWLALEHALKANGESGQETFAPILAVCRTLECEESGVLFDLYNEAAYVSKGDLVTYSNPRARAKFAADSPQAGQKVPVGTVGKLFWEGVRGLHYGGTLSWGVRCADGSVFFSSHANFDDLPANAWDKVQKRLETEALIDQRWPSEHGRPRGHRTRALGKDVELNGVQGYIFWAKFQGGDLRIGVKRHEDRNKRDAKVEWGVLSESKQVVRDAG